MSLIECKECHNDVSSEAKTCPKCGARVKPRSNTWVLLLGIPLVLLLFAAAFGGRSTYTPEQQAKQREKDTYDLCMSDLNDPLKSNGAKLTIIRPVCERMRDEYVRKYGTKP